MNNQRNRHGKKYEIYVIKKYGLIEVESKIDKWDAYGYDDIKIQIKIHKKGNDIILGSIKNYSFMERDFLLNIGEYIEEDNNNLDNLDINNVKINTYYIDHIKWNIFFKFNEEEVNFLYNEKKIKKFVDNYSQDINEYREKYYQKYGNYDDNTFTKIKFRLVKRNNNRKDEKEWKVLIKNQMIKQFLNTFRKVNIIDYSCDYNNELKLFYNIIY
jgi:hypothetical protein